GSGAMTSTSWPSRRYSSSKARTLRATPLTTGRYVFVSIKIRMAVGWQMSWENRPLRDVYRNKRAVIVDSGFGNRGDGLCILLSQYLGREKPTLTRFSASV